MDKNRLAELRGEDPVKGLSRKAVEGIRILRLIENVHREDLTACSTRKLANTAFF